MERFHATYEVKHDAEILRRATVDGMRAHWYKWLKYGLNYGSWFLVITIPTWLVCSYFVGSYRSDALFASCCVAIVAGLLIPVLYYSNALREAQSGSNEGEVWQCTMDDEGWTFRASTGLARSIPWKLMRISYEHEAAWFICFGEQEEVWVYREPLRKAGLEEEFKKRIGKKPAEAT